MIGLLDCNNFYASCERLFRPELRGKPIVVLSNNDGCVIARSDEAKALGVAMGVPEFQIRDLIKEKDIHVFSSNYELYADMSARVMNNTARFVPRFEVYSIDEGFLDLQGMAGLDDLIPRIRETVISNTGIPVSIGVAPSKTLAKLANKLGKKSGTGYYIIDTPERIAEAVKDYPVEDLWGIGRQYCKKLSKFGIHTAGDIRDQPGEFMRKEFTIMGYRLWLELHGRPCYSVSNRIDRKKGICSSRAFGKYVTGLEGLEEAVSSYAGRVAEKLRIDKSIALNLQIFLQTNQFNEKHQQYFPSVSLPLPFASNSSQDLVTTALHGLRLIYKPGYKFIKAGVIVTGLIPEGEVQYSLFQSYNGTRKNKISRVMDKLNKYYGRGTVRLASEGFNQKWNMQRNYLSPGYTTKWGDIVKVF